MARVRSIAPGTQNLSHHPSEVDCFWQTLTGPRGETIVHLSSFGSDNRQSKPKSSQSLQFDRAQAEQLLGVLAAAFPGLVVQPEAEPSVEDAAPRQGETDDAVLPPADDELACALLESRRFRAQWSLAGRVALEPGEVSTFIGRLAAAPGTRLPLLTVARTMGVRPARLQGALAMLEKVMNVEGYPVVTAADAHLLLDVPLLREQFALNH